MYVTTVRFTYLSECSSHMYHLMLQTISMFRLIYITWNRSIISCDIFSKKPYMVFTPFYLVRKEGDEGKQLKHHGAVKESTLEQQKFNRTEITFPCFYGCDFWEAVVSLSIPTIKHYRT